MKISYLFILVIFLMFPLVIYCNQDENYLEINKPVKVRLEAGQMHDHKIILKQNNFFHITVKCIGIDIKIEFLSKAGEILNRVNENSINQTEKLVDIAEVPGEYTIRITSMNKNAPTGDYEIELNDSQAVELNDSYKQQILARKLFMMAETLAQTDGGSEEANVDLCKQAISKYTEAISLYKNIGDTRRACELIGDMSELYLDYLYKFPDSYQKALDNYRICLELCNMTNDYYQEGLHLQHIAYTLKKQKKYKESIEYYKKSIAVCRDYLHDVYEEALPTANLGVLFLEMNEPEEALNYFEKAINLAENAKFFHFCGSVCEQILNIYIKQNNKEMILKTYDKEITYYKLAEAKKELASTFSNKAQFYRTLYFEENAISNYQESLKLYREINDKKDEAIILNNIGSIYDDYGETYKALEYYEAALVVAKPLNNNDVTSSILSNSAIIYASIRDYEKAISNLEESLSLTPDSSKSIRLSNLGSVYSSFGNFESSLLYYAEALKSAQKDGDERSEAVIRNNMGIDQTNTGDIENAKNNFSLALNLFKKANNLRGQATSLTKLADLELRLGKKENAKTLLEESLKLREEIQDRVGEIYTRNLLGITNKLLGNKEVALLNFNKSLSLSRELFDKNGELITLYNLSLFQKDSGDLLLALKSIQQAILEIEVVRSRFLSRNFQSTYFATNQKYYELYVEILMGLHKIDPKQGYDVRAFEVSEQMRARHLLDLVANATTTEDFSALTSNDFKTYEELERQLSFLGKEIIKLKTENKREELQNLQEKFSSLKNKLELLVAKNKTSTVFTPLTLQSIQNNVLDTETVLVQYCLAEENSYIWLVTNNGIVVFSIPGRENIEPIITKLYSTLVEKNRDIEGETKDEELIRLKGAEKEYKQLNLTLSKILISPIEKYLENKKRLLISTDGKLSLVPFAALVLDSNSDTKFLIENYEIVNVPSASTIALIREKHQQETKGQKILVVSDPVFSSDDERITSIANKKTNANTSLALNKTRGSKRGLRFSRVVGTQKEESAINETFPGSTETINGLKATKEAIISSNLLKYYMMHFGTHSIADNIQPEFSTIVLSLVDNDGKPIDGFLTFADILKLKLSAKLIVLSSCETAVGKIQRGEGSASLSRAFFYAGAKSAISTLWSVNDASTGTLMAKFYKNMKITKGNASSSLKSAQLEMLKNTKYSSPYYWAAFQIEGDWK